MIGFWLVLFVEPFPSYSSTLSSFFPLFQTVWGWENLMYFTHEDMNFFLLVVFLWLGGGGVDEG